MFCLGHYNFKHSLSLPNCLFSVPHQHFCVPCSLIPTFPLIRPALSQMFEHLFLSFCGFSAHQPYVFCLNRMNSQCSLFLWAHYNGFSLLVPFLVPSPPTFFTKAINTTAVQVLWELPNKPGKTEGFRLSYRRVPHGEIQGPIQLPCHVNAHTISHLGEGKWVFDCMNYMKLLMQQ